MVKKMREKTLQGFFGAHRYKIFLAVKRCWLLGRQLKCCVPFCGPEKFAQSGAGERDLWF